MLSKNQAICVRGLSKSFRVYGLPINRLKQFLLPVVQKYFSMAPVNYYSNFLAIDNISFDVYEGEMFAIIGRNGAGKSTLLQIICGLTDLTSGEIHANGRIAAMLELGSGFNSDFTGRENVYIYGQILGMTIQEIDNSFGDICSFADIGDYINQPIKTYSTGMVMRLAFSVAIFVRPKILIVDEALSVGDSVFQFKCIQAIEKLRKEGVTILLTTHDTTLVKRSCNRAMWIHDGKIVSIGNASEVVGNYEDFIRSLNSEENFNVITEVAIEKKIDSSNQAHAKILKFNLLDAKGSECTNVITGGAIKLRITYEVFHVTADGLVLGVAIFRNDDLYVCGLNTLLDKFQIQYGKGLQTTSIKFKNFNLLPGTYYFRIAIFDSTGGVVWDVEPRACTFKVMSPYVADGVALIQHEWINND